MSGVQIPHARLINTKTMEIYTVQQFQERWDEMIERVENGERIGIIDDNGHAAVMVPADEELIRIYTDHEEGC
jgi:antitoxin (DNA-binding transcriptional repressor) of toxin-antitoxin stability system